MKSTLITYYISAKHLWFYSNCLLTNRKNPSLKTAFSLQPAANSNRAEKFTLYFLLWWWVTKTRRQVRQFVATVPGKNFSYHLNPSTSR